MHCCNLITAVAHGAIYLNRRHATTFSHKFLQRRFTRPLVRSGYGLFLGGKHLTLTNDRKRWVICDCTTASCVTWFLIQGCRCQDKWHSGTSGRHKLLVCPPSSSHDLPPKKERPNNTVQCLAIFFDSEMFVADVAGSLSVPMRDLTPDHLLKS